MILGTIFLGFIHIIVKIFKIIICESNIYKINILMKTKPFQHDEIKAKLQISHSQL